ncbi:MAG TPA: hypothetical protein VEU32_12815 [Burkholderiales bacterium]|nr:hypothetical protein [Burkholderiales bacterium]
MTSRGAQRGYMIEIPIIVVVILVIAMAVVPSLPPLAQKIVAALTALALIAGAYYMIVIPGWQPGAKRLRWPWNWVAFIPVALLIALVAAAFVAAH